MGIRRLRRAAVVTCVLLAPGFAGAEEWFDAYEKGLEALAKRQASRAAELFERAIRKRPEPGQNLITYGTNRVDAYHPYLRLAEAHLLAGNLEGAREALARSTARGKEPADRRAALAAQLEGAERARAAAAAPPTTMAAAPPPGTAPPATAPPATVAAAPPTTRPAAPVAAPAAAPVTPAVGALVLASQPDGATVLLDGRLLGATPLRVDVAAGTHQVTLRKDGFAEQSFPVLVAPGRATSETRALVATAASPPPTTAPAVFAEVASLVVYSSPPGASVSLDDEPLGVTDPGSGRLIESGVAPGPHRLRLSLAGHEDLTQDVEVAPAGPTTVRLTLVETRILGRGGVAVVAFLVGVGALLLGWGTVLWRRRRAEGEVRATVVLPRPAAGRTPAGAATGTPRRATAVSPPTELEEPTRAVSGPRTPTSAGVGERFGDYLLLEPLGKGGMAAVFKAERNGEHYALKRPLPALLEEPEFLERFLREAEIGRTLHHPNIIRIFERGEVGGIPYFTMELVRGQTLQSYVRRTGALDPKSAAKIIVQVAEALDYAHLKGVVHRDLKPSNIMVLEDGTAKVMDYGIARARRFEGLTVTGAFLGTPDYVAPETAEGRPTDARSDLYSLGIVFYEILTGKKPFVGETPFATLKKHCTEPPTPPSLVMPGTPRELEAIILKLLMKDPAERHPGAEELLIELRDYLNRAA